MVSQSTSTTGMSLLLFYIGEQLALVGALVSTISHNPLYTATNRELHDWLKSNDGR